LNQARDRSTDEAIERAANLIAGALAEIQEASLSGPGGVREELSATRKVLESLTEAFKNQLAEQQEQRALLVNQLGGLAGALDRLVTHLQGMSELMADLLSRVAVQQDQALSPEPEPQPAEPAFLPGGEGLTLLLGNVPGFQALMDFQKALMALDEVEGASVERFQDGDSRLLLQLRSGLTGGDLAAALSRSTGHNIVVEEARPEIMHLRLKVVGS
jgi:hypothetical protein